MTVRAHVKHDIAANGVNLYLMRETSNGPLAAMSSSACPSWVPVAEGAEAPTFVSLDDASGRALLDALLEHYQGGGATRQQRADFEHERSRVDRLIGHLMGEAQR